MNKDRLEKTAVAFEASFNAQIISDDRVIELFNNLLPLITLAKAKKIDRKIEDGKIPGAYQFNEGLLRPYQGFEKAFVDFRLELMGGITPKGQDALDIIDRL